MRAVASILLAVLAACDSEKFSWSFVSNPSGDDPFAGGGAVLIIRHNGSNTALGDGAFRFLRQAGTDVRGEAATVYLAAGSDTAATQLLDRVELRSVLFDEPMLLRGASLATASGPTVFTIAIADSAVLHPFAFGLGTLHVADVGNLLALEHQGGLILWGTSERPETLGLDHHLDLSGPELRVLLPDQRLRILTPRPPPPIDDRIGFNPGRNSIRIYGPERQLLAELPRDRVVLAGGAQGVFLSAVFPDGVSERDRVPLSLLMAEQNRYLLRVETR